MTIISNPNNGLLSFATIIGTPPTSHSRDFYIFAQYLRNICNICTIFVQYLTNFCKYLHIIFTIFGRYSVSAQFGASEAFLILVTLYEKAKQKSSRGGAKFLAFSTLCRVSLDNKMFFS